MGKSMDSLVWIDMEMSGLNPDTDVVLEVAVLITNNNLEITHEGPELIIKQDASLFETMDDWNKEHHTKSGLWNSVINSKTSLLEAEDQIMRFLDDKIVARTAPLCGNSIAQDRLFIRRYMPRLEAFLHYRMIDVSTVKELVKRWHPQGKTAPHKAGAHRAMGDIRESLAELKFYRDNYFPRPE